MAKYMTAQEVSRELSTGTRRFSTQAIYRMIRRGTLPAIRLGRIVMVSEDALSAFLDNGGKGLPGAGDLGVGAATDVFRAELALIEKGATIPLDPHSICDELRANLPADAAEPGVEFVASVVMDRDGLPDANTEAA